VWDRHYDVTQVLQLRHHDSGIMSSHECCTECTTVLSVLARSWPQRVNNDLRGTTISNTKQGPNGPPNRYPTASQSINQSDGQCCKLLLVAQLVVFTQRILPMIDVLQ
jgi:hypothetical protein